MAGQRRTLIIAHPAKWIMFAAATVAAGCSATPVAIPHGHWTGTGTFVYERRDPAQQGQAVHRDYPTCLTISSTELDGRPATQLEIISKHGGIPGLQGDKTHLRVGLLQTSRPSPHIALYQVVALDPDPGKPLELAPADAQIGASCIRTRSGTVLQINYADEFVDTFRFRGRGLTKAGSLIDESALIQWTESLQQVSPADVLSSRTPFY